MCVVFRVTLHKASGLHAAPHGAVVERSRQAEREYESFATKLHERLISYRAKMVEWGLQTSAGEENNRPSKLSNITKTQAPTRKKKEIARLTERHAATQYYPSTSEQGAKKRKRTKHFPRKGSLFDEAAAVLSATMVAFPSTIYDMAFCTPSKTNPPELCNLALRS